MSNLAEKSSFYEDGTLRTLERHLNGRLHGEILLYWPNGQLKRKCHFDRGVRHGTDQIWNMEGKLVDEDLYEQGRRQ